MKKVLAVTAALALLCLGSLAQANVFDLGTGYTNLETVAVGDPGNAADTRYGTYGSVWYNYNIGKYEVTNAQYCDFLNHKAISDPYYLYSNSMYGKIGRSGNDGHYVYTTTSDWANRPVGQVSYWDACRFANWLNNGQGTGDTETGAYTLDGYYRQGGSTIARNAGAKWCVPTEHEWYKAAYYKGGTGAGYWDYPTQSNSVPSNDVSVPDAGNNANFSQNGYSIGSPYYTTNVGEFEASMSAYGTFDQGGNVWEWSEVVTRPGFAFRGLRGGSAFTSSSTLSASTRIDSSPDNEADSYGFRVVYVPEPSPIIALLGGLVGLLGIRRRRA